MARRLRENGEFIVDPTRPLGSRRNAKRLHDAEDMAAGFAGESSVAIAAAAQDALDTLIKSVERSRNIKGEVVYGLWQGLTSLTAACTVLGEQAREHGRDSPEAETNTREVWDLRR